MQPISLLLRKVVLGLFTVVYACVRPWLGPHGVCRFTPTCSEYAQLALIKYGVLKGLWLACRRVLKCHPFHTGGYDPVP